MTISLFVWWQKYTNTTVWNFMKKLEYGSWSKLDGIKFENDLDHHLDTKKKLWIFQFTYYYMPWQRSACSECSYLECISYKSVI